MTDKQVYTAITADSGYEENWTYERDKDTKHQIIKGESIVSLTDTGNKVKIEFQSVPGKLSLDYGQLVDLLTAVRILAHSDEGLMSKTSIFKGKGI